jgi:hypothetical protein
MRHVWRRVAFLTTHTSDNVTTVTKSTDAWLMLHRTLQSSGSYARIRGGGKNSARQIQSALSR